MKVSEFERINLNLTSDRTQVDRQRLDRTTIDRTKGYIMGALLYWENHKPLSEYQQGIETGLKVVQKFIEGIDEA